MPETCLVSWRLLYLSCLFWICIYADHLAFSILLFLVTHSINTPIVSSFLFLRCCCCCNKAPIISNRPLHVCIPRVLFLYPWTWPPLQPLRCFFYFTFFSARARGSITFTQHPYYPSINFNDRYEPRWGFDSHEISVQFPTDCNVKLKSSWIVQRNDWPSVFWYVQVLYVCQGPGGYDARCRVVPWGGIAMVHTIGAVIII